MSTPVPSTAGSCSSAPIQAPSVRASAPVRPAGRKISAGLRVGYAFLGLLSGNLAVLLLFIVWMTSGSIRTHRLYQVPFRQFLDPQVLLIWTAACGVVSTAGWLVVCLPIVFALPTRAMIRLSWLETALIGLPQGPASLLLIVLLLNRGRLHRTDIRVLWIFLLVSALMSCVGFAVYAALVRWKSRSLVAANRRSGAPSSAPPLSISSESEPS